MNQLITIGELARALDINIDTLRYYEKEGLIAPKSRTKAGYRLYGENEIRRIQFVLHAKAVGYSLQEVKHLLTIRTDKTAHSCQQVKDYTAAKISEMESKIKKMKEMTNILQKMHDACCGGPESAKNCSILQMLDDKAGNMFNANHRKLSAQ